MLPNRFSITCALLCVACTSKTPATKSPTTRGSDATSSKAGASEQQKSRPLPAEHALPPQQNDEPAKPSTSSQTRTFDPEVDPTTVLRACPESSWGRPWEEGLRTAQRGERVVLRALLGVAGPDCLAEDDPRANTCGGLALFPPPGAVSSGFYRFHSWSERLPSYPTSAVSHSGPESRYKCRFDDEHFACSIHLPSEASQIPVVATVEWNESRGEFLLLDLCTLDPTAAIR